MAIVVESHAKRLSPTNADVSDVVGGKPERLTRSDRTRFLVQDHGRLHSLFPVEQQVVSDSSAAGFGNQLHRIQV